MSHSLVRLPQDTVDVGVVFSVLCDGVVATSVAQAAGLRKAAAATVVGPTGCAACVVSAVH